MNYRYLLLLVLSFVFIFTFTDGVIIKQKMKTSSYITTLERFGINTGGSVTVEGIHYGITKSSAYTFICTYKQHLDIISDTRSREKICDHLEKDPSQCYVAILNGTAQTFDISERDIYDFLIVNCNKNSKGVYGSIDIEVEISAINPGPSHLPYGFTPLPNGFLFLTICYLLIFVAWTILLLKFRFKINNLHKFFYGLLTMKVVVVVISLIYWKVYQSTGKKYLPLFYIRGLLYTISETVLIFLLLLISKGWQIVRTGMEPQEFRFIPLPLLFLFLSLTFFSIYNDGYYMMAMIILYFLVMPKLFFNITEIIRALKIQLLIVQTLRLGNEPQRAIKEVLLFYKVIRISTLFYVVSTLLASGTRIFMAWYFEWITIMSGEIISLIMLGIIAYFISPHHFDLLTWNENLFNEEAVDLLLSNPNFLSMLRSSPTTTEQSIDLNSAVVVEWPDKSLSLCTKDNV